MILKRHRSCTRVIIRAHCTCTAECKPFTVACLHRAADDIHHAQKHLCIAALWLTCSLSVQLAELDAQKHAGLVQSVASDIAGYQAPDMPALVEFVRDTSARLGVIMTDEAAVLSQFPTRPQVRLKLNVQGTWLLTHATL